VGRRGIGFQPPEPQISLSPQECLAPQELSLCSEPFAESSPGAIDIERGVRPLPAADHRHDDHDHDHWRNNTDEHSSRSHHASL
jgi:hypothetical protein